jgi:hypothetical protein
MKLPMLTAYPCAHAPTIVHRQALYRVQEGYVVIMDNLGAPVSYLALQTHLPVYDRDGNRIGVIEHVLADEGSDIFHGLVVRAEYLLHRPVFAARGQIDTLYERGVTLTVTADDLREPAEDPIAADATDDSVAEQAREGLRRAWEWLQRPQ